MQTLQINPVLQPNFEADAVADGEEIAVRFSGTADLNAKSMMDGFLMAVHEEATRLHTRTVNVDISGLEFINSSCLMAIVTWITGVQAMQRRYQISFHFKSIRDWHKRSLPVLSQLGAGVVSIKPDPAIKPAPADDDQLAVTRVVKGKAR